MVEKNAANVSGNDLVGMKEICQFMRRSEPTVLGLIQKEGLPAKKIGSVWESSKKLITDWKNMRGLVEKLRVGDSV